MSNVEINEKAKESYKKVFNDGKQDIKVSNNSLNKDIITKEINEEIKEEKLLNKKKEEAKEYVDSKAKNKYSETFKDNQGIKPSHHNSYQEEKEYLKANRDRLLKETQALKNK